MSQLIQFRPQCNWASNGFIWNLKSLRQLFYSFIFNSCILSDTLLSFSDEEKRKEAVTEYMTADKIRTEQSYVFLNEVYSIVTNVYKQRPVIIDADDLQENPGTNHGEV